MASQPSTQMLLMQMRVDAQRAFLKQQMSRPPISSVQDSRSRRGDPGSETLVFGSTGTCDVSSAIVATNVVRADEPPEDEE